MTLRNGGTAPAGMADPTPPSGDTASFWRQAMKGVTLPTPLWLDRGTFATQPGDRRVQRATLDKDAAAAVRRALTRTKVDAGTMLDAAWALLLRRYGADGPVVFGGGGDGRTLLVLQPSDDEAASAWLARVDVHRDAARSHAAPDETLRTWCEGTENRPFIQSRVLIVEDVEKAVSAASPDVPLSLFASRDLAILAVSYDVGHFDDWTGARLGEHMGRVLAAFARAPQTTVGRVPLLDAAERAQVVTGWNDTTVDFEAKATIPELFDRQVAERPESVAVSADDGALTYRDLDQRASRLAQRLVGLGVKPDTPVGIFLERSLDTIVALLGTLRAGGAYLALEALYPRERLGFMLADAEAPVVLTHRSLRDFLPSRDGQTVLVLDEAAERDTQAALPGSPPDVRLSAHHLAYLTYTSGSTGTPKGVQITHRAVNRLVCAVDYVELGPAHVLLQAAPLAFDASTLEVWGALLTGGRVVMHPEPVPTARGLAEVIERHGVTTMWLTAALFNTVVDEDPQALRGLKQLLTGGEALSVAHVRRAMDALPQTQLINGYGPTESTTFTTTHRIPRDLDPSARSIPIGRPIRDTQVLVLDAHQEPVPVGVAGELYIGGEGLARGYLKRPELTAEKFVPHPFGKKGERLYRTGDLVRWLPDGTIDFIGRIDTQVKIRGFRIEPGEIEAALLRHPDVERAAVVPREDTPGFKRLVAYLVARQGATPPSASDLRALLERSLPEYMVPSAQVWLPTLPVTPNGKLDVRALPAPGRDRPNLQESYVAPRSEHERALCEAFGRVLDMDGIGVRDNFFELGGNSLLALRLLALVRQERGWQIPPVKFFQFPQPEALARWIDGGEESLAIRRRAAAVGDRRKARAGGDGVAIVGLAGRFPGAASVEELWRVICEARDTITRFSPNELDPSLDPDLVQDPQYVPARGVIDGVEMFDAAFFGINPKEAELMDPQQRVFLEVAWEALERAGYCPDTYEGAIGVFGGMYNATYYQNHVATRPDLVRRVGEFQTMVANEKDYIATRVAHKLNLTGPAISIHTACSTSLVAVCQAFDSLRSRQCDVALAGGVAVTAPPRSGYLYQEGNMLSPDGHTRTFDADAQGTVFCDGVAMVVLKRLDDALEDGDTIWGVIRGAAVNNDGGNRASFTAPSVEGQASVVAMAHSVAGVDPRTIGYVETHGTATPLGDPIEVEALTQAFRLGTADRGFCGIGSLKSNVGHMVIAAGASGLIKTALALTHKKLPPTAHFKKPNPKIDFDSSPFYVVGELKDWEPGDTPRRAGVSSFGVGGTNAHVVVEEPPETQPSGPAGPRQVLLLSARSQDALDAASGNLATHLRAHPDQPLADVAYTLQTGRKGFAYRRAVVAGSPEDAATAIERRDPQRVFARRLARQPPELAFMFPGQGAQYVNMGRTLYRDEPKFREAMDECVAAFRPILGRDLKELLFVDGDSEAAADAIRATSITQPSLFAIEYALARLLLHWGLTPSAMIGHSVGEFVCAALAGVMAPADAARLVAHRGSLMQALPPGSMLSVRLGADVVRPRLGGTLEIASENGPALCVVSGPTDDVARLQAELEADGVVCRHLHTSHAFHSPMMDPVVEPFAKLVRAVRLSAPAIPFVSTVTGTWITPEQATDPMYWAGHLRATVRFATGVRALWEGTPRLLLEVGPRATLSTLARQQVTDRETQIAVPTLADRAEDEAEWTALLAAVGQLWLSGISIDWNELHAHGKRRRVVLPTYPFERKRFWIDPAPRRAVERSAPEPSASIPALAAATPTIPQPAAADAAALPVVAVPAIPHAAISDRPREGANPMATASTTTSSSRPTRLIPKLAEIFEEVSGIEIETGDTAATFMELGLDSLALTQIAQQLQRAFGVKITFRQLMEDCSTLQSLAESLDRQMPAEAEPAAAPAAPEAPSTVPATAAVTAAVSAPAPTVALPSIPVAAAGSAAAGTLQYVIDQQLALMRHQLVLLGGTPAPGPVAAASQPAAATPIPAATTTSAAAAPSAPAAAAPASAGTRTDDEAHTKYDVKKAFGAIARIHTARAEEMTPTQKARLDAFVRRFTSRTKGSKTYTQANRGHLADPRAVTGFKPLFKELIYPIVSERSAGSRFWDVDGNEYVDVLCGFGSNYFGWQPRFVTEAVKAQIDSGYQIGPQHKLAGEVARLFCDVTGHERAAFCNTGSEAVMGCTRVARTVTGRSLIAMFTGAYHGIFDEVIVRGTKKLRSVPAAPGIMPAAAQNVLVLDYGTPETLEILRSKADELAAILVEPVQSRRPDLQPVEFLHQLRDLTSQSGTVLVFDEVVCGFRVHPRGAQGQFGIQADLASYGKVIGGGYPIGVIAGKRQYMDALDGGFWQFGDDSFPTVGVTYFAGTFVRHPLALMAAKAVLEHLQAQGPQLQESINGKTAAFVEEMNEHFKSVGAPIHIKHFSSIWKPLYTEEQAFGELLFFHLRERGVHILDGFPCFFTTAHTDEDIAFVAKAFKDAVAELQQSELLPGSARSAETSFDASTPPVPGARLGRDRDGSPAWFVPHPEQDGKFVKVS